MPAARIVVNVWIGKSVMISRFGTERDFDDVEDA
jgi:hypothetical protein